MFLWFRKKEEAFRCASRTAAEWYFLQRCPQYRDSNWSSSLAEAVREITSREPAASLIDFLVTDSSDAVRCVAAIQLGVDQPANADVALIAVLQDESETVRRAAAESLVQIGSVKGLAAVVAGSRHGHAIRTKAALRLAAMNKGHAVDAIPALMILLQYPDINWRTHYAAIDALCVIGDRAIPALRTAYRHGSTQLRNYAAQALTTLNVTEK